MNRSSFNFRTLVSLLLGWSFLALMVSGSVLYISPAGRIANWNGWTLVGLHKDQWQAVHVVVALLFLIGGAFHLLKFNWRAFKNYMSIGGTKARRFHRELAGSLALFLVLVVGATAGWVPFSYLMEGSEKAKEYWEARQQSAPVPHMELMTVREVSQRLNTAPDKVIKSLQAGGVNAPRESATLKEVADQSETTPRQLYDSLRKQLDPQLTDSDAAGLQSRKPEGAGLDEGHAQGSGAGWGRKTIEQVANEIGLEPATVLQRLKQKGFDVKADENLRDVSQRHNLRPYELVDMIRGK